jgi:hypothetical protein
MSHSGIFKDMGGGGGREQTKPIQGSFFLKTHNFQLPECEIEMTQHQDILSSLLLPMHVYDEICEVSAMLIPLSSEKNLEVFLILPTLQ